MSYRPVTAWLFGKLPVHGDFVMRGLTGARRDRLDQWLSAEMAEARRHFGDAFDALYDQAPPWRFAGRGDDGASWSGGMLCASMDSAGRRFPLIVARSAPDAGAAAMAAALCEGAVHAAFGAGDSADGLLDRLVKGAADPVADDGGDDGAQDGWWIAGDDGAPVARTAGDCPRDILVRMLELVA